MQHTLLRYLMMALAVCCGTFCLGDTSVVKTGVGIFDTLFIAENGGLRIHGDVYLKQAHVLGKGRLIVQGKNHSKIISDRSEVNNLEITTHTTIRLEGELAVNQSLTIQSGTFDISAGKLDVADSASIQLQNGGHILQHTRITSLPVRSNHAHQIELAGKAILTSLPKGEKNFSAKIFQQYDEAASYQLVIYRDVASVPPERIKNDSV